MPPGPGLDLVELLRKLQRTSSLSVGQIAVRTELSPSHISEVLRGRKSPSTRSAAAIAQALGAGPNDVRLAFDLAEKTAALNRYNRRKAAEVAADLEDSTLPGLLAGVEADSTIPVITALRYEGDAPPAGERRPRAGWRVVAPAALIAAVIGGGLFVAGLRGSWFSSGSLLVSGSATCESSRPVVGVWIAAADGQQDSGFAHLGLDSATAGNVNGPSVTYSYLIPHGGSYVVHVGCGGTARNWDSTSLSPVLSSPTAQLRCDDPARTGPGKSTSDGTCTAG